MVQRRMCGPCAHPRGACHRGVPTLVGNPSPWDTFPRRMPFPGMPILGICPPLWDAYPREKPISGHVLCAEFPSRWGACSSGRTVPGGCPFQRDAHSRGMPILEGSLSRRGACPRRTAMPAEHLPTTELPPTFATAFLRLWPDPTHGCGAVCEASGHLCPLWPLPR